MTFPGRFPVLTCLLMGLLLLSSPGCKKKSADDADNKEAEGAVSDGTPAGDAKAALYDAAKRLEDGDFRGFMENFIPAQELSELQQRNRLEQTISRMETQAERNKEEVNEVIKVLKAAAKETPVMSRNDRYAVFTVTKTDAPEKPSQRDGKAEPKIVLKGYDGELNEVITQAIDDLGKENYDAFIDRLYPEDELKRLVEFGERSELIDRLKASAETDDPRLSNMPGEMVTELQKLKELTPKMEGDTVAVYTLEREPFPGTLYTVKRTNLKVPPRVIKFEKVKGHWRFFDAGQDESKAFSLLWSFRPKSHTQTTTIEMEKIGDSWRLAKMPR